MFTGLVGIMPDDRLSDGLPALLVRRLPLGSIPSCLSVRYIVGGGVVNVSAVRADETALLSSLGDCLRFWRDDDEVVVSKCRSRCTG